MPNELRDQDAPAWGWIVLTVIVCAYIGVAPQAHAFEVVGITQAVPAALRWQVVTAALWAVAAAPIARRWSLAEREGRAIVGLLLLALGVSLVSAWSGYLLLPRTGTYTRGVVVTELVMGALPTHALTATMLSLVGSWTNARRQRARAADREALLAAHATRAELDALRERMQPHFVLNALNTVAALARRGDAEAAGEAAADLGEVLQFSLSATDDLVAFDTERSMVERYVAIEQARFGERLQVTWNIDAAAHTTRVPALSWQPLVENAIRHDITRRADGGRLHLAAVRHHDMLHLSVEVDAAPSAAGDDSGEPAPFGGLGVGTATLERRLALLYGGRASLERETPDGTQRVTLRIPLPTT